MTFSILQIVTVLILGCTSFISGWLLRRIQAKAREVDLQKSLQEAQGTIPQLQTHLLDRDQRLASLADELRDWKGKIPALEALVKRRGMEALAQKRELNLARTELGVLKQAAAAAPPVSAEAFDALRESLRTSQARCAELATSLAQHEQAADSVAPLVGERAGDATAAREPAIDWVAKVGALAADIQTRDRKIDDLQAQLDTRMRERVTSDVQQRERAAEIEHLRAEAGKWQGRVPKLLETIKARDGVIADHDAALAAQGRLLSERDATLVEQDRALVALTEELKQQRADEAAARTSIVAAQQQIATLTTSIDATTARAAALTAQLGERDAAMAVLDSRLVAQAGEAEAALAQHTAKLTAALRIGREDLDSHRATVTALEVERDGQAARLKTLEGELEALRRQHAETTAATQTRADRDGALLKEFARVRDQLVERLAAADAQLAFGDRQRAVLEAERTALAERASALLQQNNEAQQNAVTLQQSLHTMEERAAETQIRLIESEALRGSEQAAAEKQIAALQQQQGSVDREVALAEQAVANARQAQTAAEARAERAETQRLDVLAQRTSLEDRIGGLLSEQGDIKETAAAMQRALNAARDEQMKLEAELSHRDVEMAALRDELTRGNTGAAPLEDMLRERDAMLEARAQRIEVLTSQIETLDATLWERATRISELETAIAARPSGAAQDVDLRADDLEQRVAAQIEKNRELSLALDERDRELAVIVKERDWNEKSLRVLKQQLDGARESEERLAGMLRERNDRPQRSPERDAGETGPAAVQPQGLFQSPPDQIDDLQKIRGIGAGFERGLNKLGIYRFSQLAGRSAAELAWIEDHLPTFRGRVERDDWPGQAAALIAAAEPGEWSLRAPPEVAATGAPNAAVSVSRIN